MMSESKRRRWCAATVMGFTAATMAGIALADDATSASTAGSGPALEEITVTATRRGEQSQLSVPLAVDAISGEQLENAAVSSFQDVSKIDPSLNVQSYGATQQQLVIRGIASSIGQTTGVYLNDTPLLGGYNGDIFGDGSPGLRLHDVDHIEVLKGPQGTLFGAGSMDGTVRVVTAKPDLMSFGGSVTGSAASVDGGNDLYKGDGVLNLPIIKGTLGVRLVAWNESGGGFIDQTINGLTRSNVNDVHLSGGRVTLLWRPLDELSVTASWNYQRTEVDGSQAWTLDVGSTTAYPAPPVGPYTPYNNFSPTQEPYSQSYRLFDLTAQYDLGFGNIIATTSYGHKQDVQPDDSSPTGCSFTCQYGYANPVSYIPAIDFSDVTGELRFSSRFSGPFQIVGGGYYEHDETTNNSAAVVDPPDGVIPCYSWGQCHAAGLVQPGLGNSVLEFATNSQFDVRQYAVYAQGDYNLLKNLTATLGVRYFSASFDQTDIQQQNIAPTETPYGFDGGYALGDITTPYVTVDDQPGTNTKTTYNAALLWSVTSDLSLYARAASGFRIGGLNDSAALAEEAGVNVPGTYNPDSLWDYEGGVKVYLLDHKWYVDADYYHIDWSNQQMNVNAHGTFNYVANVGKTVTDGVELSTTYKPVQRLTLSGSANYIDARLAENLAGYGVKGDREPLVPEWSFAALADYEQPLSAYLRGYLGGDVTYRSSTYSAFPLDAPSVKLPSYCLLDLNAGVRFGGYEIGLFAQNVTNKVAYAGMEADYDAYRVYSPLPRTIGVRFRAQF